ncbi:hypothetical protein [Sphingopyxis sp. JAI128]|uniref:hypothetical protein n=1 Tax=Sphingopyxis sp. JAI128 TaxID=2723066 RepID=UPI001616A9DE|nr:hypothetical protein [Sphingopyxis sp. JAI128]MBB6424883.1 hypothetical protein [Sphingopyxis sp. JAI128]
MKIIIAASSLALLSALGGAAPMQPAIAPGSDEAGHMQDIGWEVRPDGGDKGQLRLQLRHKLSNGDMSLDAGLGARRPEFAPVRDALGEGGPVRFTVRHAAGTLDCSGEAVRAFEGKGRCRFAPNTAFTRALAERGLALQSTAEQLSMAIVDATVALADGLIAEGVRPKEADDLIAAAALGVTGDYVREIKSEAIVLTDIEDAIACKALGVDGAYMRGLAAAGYRKLNADEVVAMKAMGVTGDYAQAMNRAVGGNAN